MAWLDWKQLCMSKDDGDLGFRDLRCFNMALLTKQAWRLVTRPDLLLCRIMKARYYPNGSFLSADVGSRPSMTWRSIFAARSHLQSGLRVRIGNGHNTSIWSKWLVEDCGFKIITRRPIHTSFPNCVADIMDPNTRTWNTMLINEVFWPVDTHRILAVPIGSIHARDVTVWHFTPTGQFSVKSCYRNILARGGSSRGQEFSTNVAGASGSPKLVWRQLWNLPLPPKIKIFLWRACLDIIPTNVALFRRKVHSSPFCHSCQAIETLLHIVRDCEGMRELWRSPTFCKLDNFEAPNFRVWLQYPLGVSDSDLLRVAIVFMWKTWDNRNKILHEGTGMKIEEMVGWSKLYLDTFCQAQFQHHSTQTKDHPAKWKPPSPGVIKLNVDAAFPPDRDFYVTAMVARDHNGICIGWRKDSHMGRPPPAVGEAHAISTAMQYALDQGWNSIVVEGDCLSIMELLREGEATLAPCGMFIDDCIHLVSLFYFCEFIFVKRTGNCLANALAKADDLACTEGINLPTSLAKFAQ